MKKRMIIAIVSICTVLSTGCGAKTVNALEPTETVETAEETEVMVTESMEAIETEEVISMESTEMQEEITDADYIAMAKECEPEFKILNGEKYNCDIAIEIQGYTHIYEFPEEDVKAEECSLLFDYKSANVRNVSEEKVVSIPVSILVNGKQYLIGEAEVFLMRNEQSDGFEIVYDYENEYRKDIDFEALKAKSKELKPALIRDYNLEERTVELCYVTAIDCDTYTDYKIENEEWISVPLEGDAQIIGWSWGYIDAVHISEERFAEYVEEYLEYGYVFVTVYENNGRAMGIVQVFNP